MSAVKTLPDRFCYTAQERGPAPALRQPEAGRICEWSWEQSWAEVQRLSAALIAAGVGVQDRVLIWGRNSARWVMADLAIMSSAAVTVPVYESNTTIQAEYLLRETNTTVAFLSEPQCRALLAEGTSLKTIVLMQGEVSIEQPPDVRILTWEEFLRAGESISRAQVEERRRQIRNDHMATIIFTSGTSGRPKGAIFTHRALAGVTDAIIQHYGADERDSVLSYLPLAHSIERLLSVYLPVTVGGSVTFADCMDRMPEQLRQARPTVFIGVPRVWEKFVEGIEAKVAKVSRWRRWLFRAAFAVGRRASVTPRPGRSLRLAHRVFASILYRPLRRVLGLDAAKLLLSGGAPLRADTREFLQALGLQVLDAYGQTETVVTSGNAPDAKRPGTVGRPLPGIELRTAADGEIQVRSDSLFAGYWNDPVETNSAFAVDGWLRTGDLGCLDADGFLRITGRKKALLITSGGKNVAPEPLEAELSAIPGVAQAVVIGDGRKYLTALLTLDAAAAQRMLPPSEHTLDTEVLSRDESVMEIISERIDDINRLRAPFERIKQFRLLPHPFSTEAEEVTPTQKIRRAVVARRHAEAIESMYRVNEEANGACGCAGFAMATLG
jgi:long-chain acyl-CoA synthetase